MMHLLQSSNRVALSFCNRLPYSDDNKLLFSNGVECKVMEVYDRGAHYSREGR